MVAQKNRLMVGTVLVALTGVIGRTPHLFTPQPTANPLTCILNAGRGIFWIGGAGGTVYSYDSSDLSFQRADIETRQDIECLARGPDDMLIAAGGSARDLTHTSAYIAVSVDGGESWLAVDNDLPGPVFSLCYEAEGAWLVCAGSKLFRMRLPSGEYEDISSALTDFTDGDRLYSCVVLQDGRVLACGTKSFARDTNGTWYLLDEAGGGETVRDIQVVDSAVIVLRRPTSLVVSTDSGYTWKVLDVAAVVAASSNVILHEICGSFFWDSERGMISTRTCGFMMTEDGGQSWVPAAMSSRPVDACAPLGMGSVMGVGDYGSVIELDFEDKGSVYHSDIASHYIIGLAHCRDSLATIYTDDAVERFNTPDTTSVRIPHEHHGVYSCSFIDPATGFILAGDTLWRTRDSGMSWDVVASSLTVPHGTEVRPSLTVASENKLVIWSPMVDWALIVDRGTFDTAVSDFSAHGTIRSLDVATASTWYAVVEDGTFAEHLYVCSDQGMSWRKIDSYEPTYDIRTLAAVRGGEVIAGGRTGGGGAVLRLSDCPSDSCNTPGAPSISWMDTDHLWFNYSSRRKVTKLIARPDGRVAALGSGDLLLVSIDGGHTFEQVVVHDVKGLRDIRFSENYLWTVGGYGALLRLPLKPLDSDIADRPMQTLRKPLMPSRRHVSHYTLNGRRVSDRTRIRHLPTQPILRVVR